MAPETNRRRKYVTQTAVACALFAGAMIVSGNGAAHAQLLAADPLDQHLGIFFEGDTMDGLDGPPAGGGTPGWGDDWIVPLDTDNVTVHEPANLEVNFSPSGTISGGPIAMTITPVNSTALIYRDFPASFTGTTSDPTRDIWVSYLVRVEQTPDAVETVMVEIIGQQTSELNSSPSNVVGVGIRPVDVDGIPTLSFVAQTDSATPAVHEDIFPVGGNDYLVIAWFEASGVSGGLRWSNPRLWVFEDGDSFSIVAGNPHAIGSGQTRTYANSLNTGASRFRVRTAGLGTGDTYRLDSFRVARTAAELIGDDDPLRVDLLSFSASADGAGSPVRVNWETAAEFDNAGFNLYRAADGAPGQKLNAFPIAAQGSETEGATYSFVDSSPLGPNEVRGYYLEDVEFGGTKTLHGPARVGPFSGSRSSVASWNLYD